MASKVNLVLVLVWCCSLCNSLPDVLFLTRCRAACGTQKCDPEFCQLRLTDTKPGECPQIIGRVFDTACLEACSKDTDCPEIEKCCSNNCGTTCQHPTGLESFQGLASIPENISITEREKSNSTMVKWQTRFTGSKPLLYVVEERHHPGDHWEESYMSSWTTRKKTNKTRCFLKNLKPGHWYQVRVAAVNELGTKGFSQPSLPFTLSTKPRSPKKPKRLKVSRAGWLNGTLYCVLSWEVPESDLPIQRYRIYWSSLPENSPETSVMVKQASISNKETNYILKKLEPHTLYYLQVQAISQFGKGRLKSLKAHRFLNTTHKESANYDWQNYFNNHLKDFKSSRKDVLRHTQFFWKNERLHCRLEWQPQSPTSRYLLTWTPNSSCNVTSGHETQEATTETTSFDIYNLKFDCKYKIILEETSHRNRKMGTIYLTTPSCKDFLGSLGKQSC